jgi:competence protein ComFC
VLGTLFDGLFPKRCAGCGGGPWPFCAACRGEIVLLERPRCQRCGAPARREVRTCGLCPPEPLRASRAPFLFEGPIRRAVHRLKFAGWRPVAEALGAAMAEAYDLEADAITWVPLSRGRRASRGFDQAGALAQAVGPKIGLAVIPLLRRAAEAGPQARRRGGERRRAMLGSFAALAVPPPRVVLVDDVLTTGATAAACADALVRAGASEVSVLTAARAISIARLEAGRSGASGAGSHRSPGRDRLLYSEAGLASGSVVARGTSLRKSKPAAGEATHVSRPLVGEHGAV